VIGTPAAESTTPSRRGKNYYPEPPATQGRRTVVITDHVAYLLVTIPVTLGVGHTLFSSGRLFLIDVFSGNERTADAVNRLLLTEVY